MEKRYYNTKEISKYLGVSESAIRKWIRHGKIHVCKINGVIRFDIVIIDKWLEKNCEKII
ncbi:MAG: helix-turn-helix domain-containing protein [PVC group bacterium]|nr:helix-turn-helix domain-containing protein [PVC group bacterium]